MKSLTTAKLGTIEDNGSLPDPQNQLSKILGRKQDLNNV